MFPLPVCAIKVTILPCGCPSGEQYDRMMKAIHDTELLMKLHQFLTGFMSNHGNVCVTVDFDTKGD
jgi:hypothetical protein